MRPWTEQHEEEYLSLFPGLRDWWLSVHKRPPTIDHAAEFHLGFLARSLKASSYDRCKIWTSSVKQITELPGNFLEQILVADAFASSMKISLTDIYGKLAEIALGNNEGPLAFSALKTIADNTGLAAFRFLAAFVAFNMNDFESCIDQCELVTEPFAPIHTLLGQALLESGHPGDAIDALKVAASVAPNDPLPRVQLIKAYLVTGVQSEAMRNVDQCRKILGHHIEVECLAAMTIMAGPIRNREFNHRTFIEIASHLATHPNDLEAFAVGMELAVELNERDWAQKYMATLELTQDFIPQRFASIIAATLKKTGERQWHDLSRQILDKTIPLTRRSSGIITQ